MATTSVRATDVAPTTRAHASAAWSGIVFAVTYVAGMMMAGLSPSDTDTVKNDPAALGALWHDFYDDGGHRWTILAGGFLLAISAIAVVVFGMTLRDRLAEAGDARFGRLCFGASILFAGVTMAGGVGLAWIPGAKQFGDVAIPTGELAYMCSQLGFALLLLAGGAAAGFLLVVAGFGGWHRRVLPGWLGWAGVACGVIVFVLGVLFLPMALLVLWVLAASILLLRHHEPAPAAV